MEEIRFQSKILVVVVVVKTKDKLNIVGKPFYSKFQGLIYTAHVIIIIIIIIHLI